MKTAILVLSHFYGLHGHSDRQLKRMDCGIKLYSERKADYIIGTGGFGFFNSSETSLGKLTADYFEFKDIPKKAILYEGESKNTKENLRFALELIKKYKIKKVVVVTSIDHILRSKYLAKRIMPTKISLDFVVSDYYSTWKVTIWDFFWHIGGWIKLLMFP